MRRLLVPAVLGALACALSLSACSATSAPAPTETQTPTSSTAVPSGAQTAPALDADASVAVEACRAELESGSSSMVERLDVEHPVVTLHEGMARSNGQPFRVVEFPALPNAATSRETPRFCIVTGGDAELVSADNVAFWDDWGLPRPS